MAEDWTLSDKIETCRQCSSPLCIAHTSDIKEFIRIIEFDISKEMYLHLKRTWKNLSPEQICNIITKRAGDKLV